MNAKKAKALRKEAGYKNQSATPGVMDFPGVARMVKIPVFSKHQATKTGYQRLPLDVDCTKVHTKVTKLDVDRRGKPIMMTETDPSTGLFVPKYELAANSKPGKLRAGEPKGLYRSMKRTVQEFGCTARQAGFIVRIAVGA